MNYIKQFVVAVVLIVIMIMAVRIQIQINEGNQKNKTLAEQRDEMKYENEKMKDELDAPIDDEYIEKVASEQLGYKDPTAEYFYNNQPN